MGQDDHYYQMLNKALIWGAALFLASLGWFIPPGNTHHTFVDGSGHVRQVDTISVTGCVVKAFKDTSGKAIPSPIVGPEVIEQARGKGWMLLGGAALVVLIWSALVISLNRRRSADSQSLFPSYRLVQTIVPFGGLAYAFLILNVADLIPAFLGGIACS